MNVAEEFLDTARHLSSADEGREPTQGDLRTAAGKCYQAVYHQLMEVCANDLIGQEEDADFSMEAWDEVYRFPTHDMARKGCVAAKGLPFPKALKDFAGTFVQLQNARIAADYPKSTAVTLSEAAGLVRDSRQCIDLITGVSRQDRITFVTRILFSGKGVTDARERAKSKNPDALFYNKG